MASKLDVLQRYMGGDGKDNEKKKRKKTKSSSHVGMRVIDEDGDDWKEFAPKSKKKDLWQNDANDIDEDLPTIVDTDYDPEYQPVVANAEEFFERERAEELEKQWQDSVQPAAKQEIDASPPRKARKYSEDESPPRRRAVKDENPDDATPPRRTRKDSDASPPRRSRKDSDASPPRRARKDSDASPPRRSRRDSDASPPRRAQKDSDASPPRRSRKDSDASPPRRARKDSDASPPRRSRKDSDASPPRRARKDSDASPPRRSRKDSDATSPRRPRKDSDASPPRRSRVDSDASPPRKPKDAHASPPRRSKSGFDSSPPRRSRNDSDASPPRRSRKESDSSPQRRSRQDLNRRDDNSRRSPVKESKYYSSRRDSPPSRRYRRSPSPKRRSDRSYSPRRHRRSRSSSRRYRRDSPRSSRRHSRSRSRGRGRSPRRQSPERNARRDSVDRAKSSKLKSPSTVRSPTPEKKASPEAPTGGVYTGKEFREMQERDQKQKSALYEDEELMGKQAETVYRDKRGRKLDMLMEMERQREIQEGKRKREAVEEYEWGTGKVRKEEIKSQRQQLEDIKSKPFARYKDDAELDATLRSRARNFDPMESSLFKDEVTEVLKKVEKKKSHKPKYSGPPPPPNRFNIRPGYRWDGVVRGNNWEEKVLLRQNKTKADKADAYQFATADMLVTTSGIWNLVIRIRTGMFKQRTKKEKRKRVRLDEDESNEDGNLEILQELKEDLKHRERLKLQRTPLVTKNIETSVTNTLDGQFTVQSNMTTADQFAKIMNNYVETRLKEKYMVNEASENEPKLTEEQELYRIPDHLREKMNLPDKAPEGGIITWNTGIAEVELPQEMHDQMIQATKEALEHQKHYEQATAKSSALPTNLSANFKKHNRDYINDLKHRSREEQRAKNFHLVNPNDATDDQIMRKFRREQSKRKRY